MEEVSPRTQQCGRKLMVNLNVNVSTVQQGYLNYSDHPFIYSQNMPA